MKVEDFTLQCYDEGDEFLTFAEGPTKMRQGGLSMKTRLVTPKMFATGNPASEANQVRPLRPTLRLPQRTPEHEHEHEVFIEANCLWPELLKFIVVGMDVSDPQKIVQRPQRSLNRFQNCASLSMMNSKSVMNWINYSREFVFREL